MFLFTRIVSTKGAPDRVRAMATDMAEIVTRRSGLSVSVWTAFQGAPLGTLGFTTLVGTMSEYYAAGEPLLHDSEYLEKVAEVQQYMLAPPEDRVVQILHTAGGDYRRAEVGAVASVITAQVNNSRFGAAAQWGIEMAETVSSISGHPLMFGRAVAGGFGTLAWVSTMPDMPAYEAGDEALGKDPAYLAKLDDMGDLFVPGSGQATLSFRVA